MSLRNYESQQSNLFSSASSELILGDIIQNHVYILIKTSQSANNFLVSLS